MDKTWEDFEEDVKSASGRTRPACSIRTVLNSLPPGARTKLEVALENPAISSAAISKALRKRIGSDAPMQHTVSRHRRGDCSCS
jgi:hypothetical protein